MTTEQIEPTNSAIRAEINAGNTLQAVMLILRQSGRATAQTSRMAAFNLGETKGRELVAFWVENDQ